MKKIMIFPLFWAFILSGCSSGFQSLDLNSLGANLSNSLTCADARSKVFDAYYKAYQQDPDLSVRSTMQKDIGGLDQSVPSLKKAPSQIRTQFKNSVLVIHSIMTTEIGKVGKSVRTKLKAQSTDHLEEGELDPMLHLARLEMRSKLDPAYQQLNQKLDVALKKSSILAQEVGLPCDDSSPGEEDPNNIGNPSTPGGLMQNTRHPLYGAHFTMATSYQSCQVLELPLVTKAIESAMGVQKGPKIDDYGWGRVYTDVESLVKTHYYHRGQSYGPGCVDQKKKPLVYDYGGKPTLHAQGLNMFVDSGGGTALGIDCSAFVSTAVAVAGNRYNPSTENKPVYTRFVSRDFIDPVESNWTCYESVQVARVKSIEPGDIGAVQGHVVMIDEVGADPFGILHVKTAAECDSLTTKNFDFAVIQSSPEKGSLGINRFEAKDYLSGSGKMSDLFLGYAKQACLSQVDGKVRTPRTTQYGIIRHKQTESCLAPRVSLVNEACVQSCSALNK